MGLQRSEPRSSTGAIKSAPSPASSTAHRGSRAARTSRNLKADLTFATDYDVQVRGTYNDGARTAWTTSQQLRRADPNGGYGERL